MIMQCIPRYPNKVLLPSRKNPLIAYTFYTNRNIRLKNCLPFLIPRMPAKRECSLRCIRIAETREKPADRLKFFLKIANVRKKRSYKELFTRFKFAGDVLCKLSNFILQI
jgi:hypothetical protein